MSSFSPPQSCRLNARPRPFKNLNATMRHAPPVPRIRRNGASQPRPFCNPLLCFLPQSLGVKLFRLQFDGDIGVAQSVYFTLEKAPHTYDSGELGLS
jgi:hypothetical protein